ncbi:hypothetical protein [Arthrobacter sp. 92]|uniref:hypothetical protein n=1 Tax=Arthrobacter sp. 92 TaxID=3418175 RepID=UPI003D076F32
MQNSTTVEHAIPEPAPRAAPQGRNMVAHAIAGAIAEADFAGNGAVFIPPATR